jgi:hypothetical protein
MDKEKSAVESFLGELGENKQPFEENQEDPFNKKTEVKELPQEEDDLKEIEEERKMLLDECGDESCPLENEEVIEEVEEGGVEEDVEEHI